MTALLVFVAGGTGVLTRYGISTLFHGPALNWATVGINVAGSFLLGMLLVLSGDWLTDQTRTALGVGFLGGFTTFSTFSVQAVLEVEAGESARALAYVMASVLGGLLAAALGYRLGRWMA